MQKIEEDPDIISDGTGVTWKSYESENTDAQREIEDIPVVRDKNERTYNW